ncbi:MAG TPA: TlpA disulfide reductase family protein [Chitinophagaceae bacterium]|jgi:thiol-disulfide isomerase/thioredoxin|nr:TlpA disulfide reductase family protein [Chitinophagaceae bacterium]
MYGDTTQFSTIEDVLKLPSLKGKVVYIDIWGTRCTPCIEEFPHLATLKKRYKNKPVAFLYLKSPYGFDDSKEWREMVRKYNLEGINVSMSITFYSNNFWNKYKDKYTEERSFSIPTYLVINKKGEIVNFDAPRPSDTEKLYKLIDREL